MTQGYKTGGRKIGTPNKITADVRALAQVHGPDVIEHLARIAFKGESEVAQIAACKELLDRGYGKAEQSVKAVDAAGNPTSTNMRVVVELVGDTAPRPVLDQRAGPRLIDLSKTVELVG